MLAILFGESMSDVCIDALESTERLLMSTVTLTETLIVASWRDRLDSAERFAAGLDLTLMPATEARARAAAAGYRKWGKGFHKAKLNLGDSFAYQLAMEQNCPLLFVGNDFAQTDVVSALPAPHTGKRAKP